VLVRSIWAGWAIHIHAHALHAQDIII